MWFKFCVDLNRTNTTEICILSCEECVCDVDNVQNGSNYVTITWTILHIPRSTLQFENWKIIWFPKELFSQHLQLNNSHVCFHSDVNCRLDMCRRQYANDACNRGTAGNLIGPEPTPRRRCIFVHRRCSLLNPPPHTLSVCLYVHLCFMCFFNVFLLSTNQINFPPLLFLAQFTQQIFIFTHFSCVKTVFRMKNYCFCPSAINLSVSSSNNAKNCCQWFITVFHSIRFTFTVFTCKSSTPHPNIRLNE